MKTVITQDEPTTSSVNEVGNETVATSTTETKMDAGAEPNAPYKVFTSKDDFDKHSAGILNNAKYRAEKELLAMLGLKPDEKDKLAKFKDAYDSTLSEAEKQAKELSTLGNEVNTLKNEIAEKDAIIVALSKLTGKNSSDVNKYVKMARGLVDENTTIDSALEQVLSYMKHDEPKTIPTGKPLNNPSPVSSVEENPFKTGNMTKQGELIKTDREKAREMYLAVYGKGPSW